MTAPHTRTATCCVLGSAIRGTLSANEIVAKDKRPSSTVRSWGKAFWRKLTHSSDYLCFKTELIWEASRKIADASTSIASNIWYFSDMVEHMAAGEEENGNQTYRSPDVTILNDGYDIWPCDAQKSNTTKDRGDNGDPANPINGTVYLGVRAARHVSCDPRVHLLSRLRSVRRLAFIALYPQRLQYPLVKSYRNGPLSTTAWGPDVGWKNRRTGAVWSPS